MLSVEEGNMDPLLSYRVGSPNIVSETFDDEVVIVNLDDGNYYSLNNVGVEIWGIIKDGAQVDEIASHIARRYGGNHNNIRESVYAFAEKLLQENLISSCDKNESKTIKTPSADTQPDKLEFKAPVLQKYTDMQELLLLDPIHEVDDSGWPSKK